MAPLVILVMWPVIEIALFVLVGGQVGVWGVLGLIVLAALLGVGLLRLWGGQAVAQLRRGVAARQDPGPALVTGALRAMGAGLLILPGFASDAIGLLLLLPPVQAVIVDRIRARIVTAAMAAQAATGGDRVVDGDYQDVTPGNPRATHVPSEWTRH